MKILVISLAGIGDTLLATPLFHELRLNFPDAAIDVLVMWAGSKDLLEGNPHLNSVHHKNLIREHPFSALKYLWGLRRQRYDISINTHPQSRTQYRLVARIVGARQRLSHEYDNHTMLDRCLVNRTAPQDYNLHTVENNLCLLRLLGQQARRPEHELEVYLSPADLDWSEHFVQQNRLSTRRLIGIHAGSGGTKNLALKRWPLANYRQLVQRIVAAHPDVTVLLFGGPEETKDNESIVRQASAARVVPAETPSLRQAAALMKKCEMFLSVDTALMHLAVAAKVPKQIVIEAPTLNKTNEPYRRPYLRVRNPAVNGRNLEYYRYDGRGIHGTTEELVRCMESVTVEAVYQAVQQALST